MTQNKPFVSVLDSRKAEYKRLGDEVSELQFQIAMMPDGRDKIRAMLLACEIYIRREDVALKVDELVAKRAINTRPREAADEETR